MKAKTSRDKIIADCHVAVWRSGYHALGIAEICRLSGIEKSSFYNYFESKNEFFLAVLNRYGEELVGRFRQAFGNMDVPFQDQTQNFLIQLEQDYTETLKFFLGCMAGNLSLELADDYPVFRASLQQVFSRVEDVLEARILHAQHTSELAATLPAREMASMMLALLEGCLLYMKAFKNERAFRLLQSWMGVLMASQVPAGPRQT